MIYECPGIKDGHQGQHPRKYVRASSSIFKSAKLHTTHFYAKEVDLLYMSSNLKLIEEGNHSR